MSLVEAQMEGTQSSEHLRELTLLTNTDLCVHTSLYSLCSPKYRCVGFI